MFRSLSVIRKPLGVCSALRFFSSPPHNLQAFNKAKLSLYCSQLPAFPELLTQLQARGQFLNSSPLPYNMSLFLEKEISSPHLLDYVPTQLMSQTLPVEYQDEADPPINIEEVKGKLRQNLPIEFKGLTEDLAFYLLLLVDVFNNKLAQRNYEAGIPDQENVSERLHGLQAAKLAALFGLSQDAVLAMLFHDLARPTHEDDHHGHSQHHVEGDLILAPLGLSLTYTWYHAYAKFLLRELCPAYQVLLSPISAVSLTRQNKTMQEQLQKLEQLDSLTLAKTLYQLMFFRLFDDFSKVPALVLPRDVQYMNDSIIRKLLVQQLIRHLTFEAKEGKDLRRAAIVLEEKLEVAQSLLVRPQEYSNNPDLYLKFRHLLEPKPGLKW